MKNLDITKPVQTRDGKPARIVSTKLGDTYPLGVIATYPDGKEVFYTCVINGKYNAISSYSVLDLINVPEKRAVWLNIYENNFVIMHTNKESCDSLASPGRIACIEVEFEVGQGL